MKVIFNYDRKYRNDIPSAIALGTFDGIHLAHRKLIEELQIKKERYGYQSIVYTFINHPLSVLRPETEPPQIMLLGERIVEFSKLGVDVLVLNSFDILFSQLTPDAFLTQLSNNFLVKDLVVGFDYRFGHKGAGDLTYLECESKKRNWNLTCVPSVNHGDEVISSSLIRKMIMNGQVKYAADLLTRPYTINGTVIHGFGRGKDLGFPTANLRFSPKKVIPKNGVYLTKCKYNNIEYWGLTNVGTNPTFSNGSTQVETYLMNFHKNIYGKKLQIHFIDRLRSEVKFSEPKDLILQMKQDVIKAKKLIYKKTKS